MVSDHCCAVDSLEISSIAAHGGSNAAAASENCCLSTAAAESGVADDQLSLTPVGPVRPKAFSDYSRSLLSTPMTSNTLTVAPQETRCFWPVARSLSSAPSSSSSERLTAVSYSPLLLAVFLVGTPAGTSVSLICLAATRDYRLARYYARRTMQRIVQSGTVKREGGGGGEEPLGERCCELRTAGDTIDRSALSVRF